MDEEEGKKKLTKGHNEATTSSSLKSTLSLERFPPELLEKIGLNLPARTITDLKCVNKQFYDIFSTDKMWKKYLYYPERYLKNDIKSGSSAKRVATIVKEISAGGLGKWHGYYKLQQARLQTWLSKDVDEFLDHWREEDIEDCINLIRGYRTKNILDMQEMVDYASERWLFFLTGNVNGNTDVNICNITGPCPNIKTLSFSLMDRSLVGRPPTPNQLEPVWVKEIMMLALEGIVLLIMELVLEGPNNGYFVAVYQFKPPDYKMDLQFKIVPDMEVCFGPNEKIPEHIPPDQLCPFRFVVVEDLFVTCKKDCVSDLNEIALHIWNFKSGIKIDKVCLNRTSIVQQFNELTRECTSQENHFKYRIELYPGYLASIIIHLFETESEHSQVYVFSLDTLQVTTTVVSSYNISECHVFEDKVCVVESTTDEIEISEGFFDYRPPLRSKWSSVSIYLVKNNIEPKLLKEVSSKSYEPQPGCLELNQIVFNKSKVLVQIEDLLDDSNVQILSLDTDPLEVQLVKVEKGYILSYIEPNLLLMYDEFIIGDILLQPEDDLNNLCVGNIQVVDTLTGAQLCKWRRAEYGPKLAKYYRGLCYPSKVVFCNNNKLDLFAFR